jgi:hypothetical protein
VRNCATAGFSSQVSRARSGFNFLVDDVDVDRNVERGEENVPRYLSRSRSAMLGMFGKLATVSVLTWATGLTFNFFFFTGFCISFLSAMSRLLSSRVALV